MQVEEVEGAVGHGGLDGADAGGGGVFAGFDIVVEEVWGAVVYLLVYLEACCMCGGGGTYSVSSGRDMVAVVLCALVPQVLRVCSSGVKSLCCRRSA